MKRLTWLISLTLICVSWGSSQTSSEVPASVSVIGEAQMSISADQVRFTFEIISSDKDVIVAKRANDKSTARTLSAAKDFNIAADDIQTESLSIAPKRTGTKDPRGESVLIGYEVTKKIFVTLKDLEKIDLFLSKVIESGVNRVVDVSIENSQYQKYQEQVRAMAMKNAQAKARAYAAQVGQTIGKVFLIREEDADQIAIGTGHGSGSGSGLGDNGESYAPDAKIALVAREITFALGQIKIEEKIYAAFELK